MFAKRLAAGLAIIFFLIGFSPIVWAEEPLNVENWPGDIPCNVLKRHPDGTYEITVAWNRFFQRHAPGTKYRNTRETQFWDQKCRVRPCNGTVERPRLALRVKRGRPLPGGCYQRSNNRRRRFLARSAGEQPASLLKVKSWV